MSDAIVSGIFGTLILLALAWLKTDLNKLSDRIDHLSERIDALSQRVAHIEGRLDEREHH